MFTNQRYLTRGVAAAIPKEIQNLLWHLIETMETGQDHLQVFRLSPHDGKLHISHSQEAPPYHREYDIVVGSDVKLVAAHLFVIDDGCCSTMLLTHEY